MEVRYLTQIPGILRILQLLFCFIGFVCILATSWGPRGAAFLVATIGGFIITLIIIVLKVLGLHEKITLPWMKVEFAYDLAMAVFLLITSALVIDQGGAAHIAGGTFGLFATIAYLIDAGDKYNRGL